MTDEFTAGMWIDVNTNNDIIQETVQLIECCRGSGTIGCFAIKDGQPVLVTCAHVLFPTDLAPAEGAVFQPRYSCCCSGDQIATPIADPLKDGKYVGFNEVNLGVKVIFNGVITDPGNVPNGFPPTETDCAAALLSRGLKCRNVWRYTSDGVVKEVPLVGSFKDQPGAKLGVTKGPEWGERPSAGQYVRIYSERLGRVVFGTVLGMGGTSNEPPPVDDPERLLTPNGYGEPDQMRPLCHQLLVLPRPDPKPSVPFAEEYDGFHSFGVDGGDSGAMVINSANQIVGMLCMGVKPDKVFGPAFVAATMELKDVAMIAVVTPIRVIEEQLGITIPDNPSGWSATVPAESARVSIGKERWAHGGARRGLDRARGALRESRRGQWILGKIAEHGREVRLMFNRVRALAAAWQHLRGPAFLHHAVQSLERPEHVVPHTIDGVSRAALANALVPIILQHAGPELRRDLQRHREWLETTFLQANSLDDFTAALAVAPTDE
jgi:hypothetical protein